MRADSFDGQEPRAGHRPSVPFGGENASSWLQRVRSLPPASLPESGSRPLGSLDGHA